MRISEWSSDGCTSDLTTARYLKEKLNDFSWLNENTATYSKSFGEHNFELLGGFTFQKYNRNGSSIQADTFADDRLPVVQGALNVNRGRSEKRRVGKECVSTC